VSNFPRKTQILVFEAVIWRRGSNSLRKMQISGSLRQSLTEGVSLFGLLPRLVAILNHAKKTSEVFKTSEVYLQTG
jgi:hypothetical protein